MVGLLAPSPGTSGLPPTLTAHRQAGGASGLEGGASGEEKWGGSGCRTDPGRRWPPGPRSAAWLRWPRTAPPASAAAPQPRPPRGAGSRTCSATPGAESSLRGRGARPRPAQPPISPQAPSDPLLRWFQDPGCEPHPEKGNGLKPRFGEPGGQPATREGQEPRPRSQAAGLMTPWLCQGGKSPHPSGPPPICGCRRDARTRETPGGPPPPGPACN